MESVDGLSVSSGIGQGAAQVVNVPSSGNWGMQMAQQWQRNRQVAAQEEANKLRFQEENRHRQYKEQSDVLDKIKPVDGILPSMQPGLNRLSQDIYSYVEKNATQLENPVVKTEIQKKINEYYQLGSAAKSLGKQLMDNTVKTTQGDYVAEDPTAEKHLSSETDAFKGAKSSEDYGRALADVQADVNSYNVFKPINTFKKSKDYEGLAKDIAKNNGQYYTTYEKDGSVREHGQWRLTKDMAEQLVRHDLTDPNVLRGVNYAFKQEAKNNPDLQEKYKSATDWWVDQNSPFLVMNGEGPSKIVSKSDENKNTKESYSSDGQGVSIGKTNLYYVPNARALSDIEKPLLDWYNKENPKYEKKNLQDLVGKNTYDKLAGSGIDLLTIGNTNPSDNSFLNLESGEKGENGQPAIERMKPIGIIQNPANKSVYMMVADREVKDSDNKVVGVEEVLIPFNKRNKGRISTEYGNINYEEKYNQFKNKGGEQSDNVSNGSVAQKTISSTKQSKQIAASKIKGLIGKPGYEGYTEPELIDYYKSQGYEIK